MIEINVNTSIDKFDESIERNFQSKSQHQLPAAKSCAGPHTRPKSHVSGSPVLNKTVVENMNSCALGSILEDNLCHKTTYSRKIELNILNTHAQ